MEVEEPADLSQVRRRESPGGEALTAVYLSHRVSAGPIRARIRFRAGTLGGGSIPTLTITTIIERAVGAGAALALPCGIGFAGAAPTDAATTTVWDRAAKCESEAGDQPRSIYDQKGERLDEEDRRAGCSKEVQC